MAKRRKKSRALPTLAPMSVVGVTPKLMQEWSPPAQLEPVTAEVYATLRMLIDSGCSAIDAYRKYRDQGGADDSGWIDPPPGVAKMAETLYRFIPAVSVSLAPAQKFANAYKPNEPAWYPDSDAARRGWPTFCDRTQLLVALQKVTPDPVVKEIGDLNRPPTDKGGGDILPSADLGGLEWWALALSAVGVLAWLGRRTLPGMLVGLLPKGTLAFLGRWLFRGLVFVGGAAALTYAGKKIIEKGAEKLGSLVPFLALGGLAAAGIAIAARNKSRGEQNRRY